MRVDELGALGHHPLGSADTHRDDGHPTTARHIRGAFEQRLHDGPALAFAFGEHHQRLTVVQHVNAALERFDIGSATGDREAAN